MPHFRTWDDIYYDYHGGADLAAINIGIGELQTDVVLRAANYRLSPETVQLNP
jgi:hypothetical protein